MSDQAAGTPVHVEGAGLSLEEVFAASLRLAGAPAKPSAIVLDRVESAGPLISSAEQKRIATWVRYDAASALGIPVQIGHEHEVEVKEAGDTEGVSVSSLPDGRGELLLAAAAALELPRSPVEVWRAAAEALSGPVTTGELREFAVRHPLLVLDGEETGFTGRAAHRSARDRRPLTVEQQRRLLDGLLDLRQSAEPASPVMGYLSATWPVHAALAGELDRWLEDPDFLVQTGWYGIGLALVLAHPEGVPLGGLAGDIHCLLSQRVAAPASHPEWLSWVHHSLVSRGLTATAEAVAAQVRLPWRTVWSHWRWPGMAQPDSNGAAAGGELHLVNWKGGMAVAQRREAQGDPDRLIERVWDFRTGEPLSGDQDVSSEAQSVDPATLAGRRARHRNGRWHALNTTAGDQQALELPWAVEAVSEAIQCTAAGDGGTLWVQSGWCGLYAILVDERAVEALPAVPRSREFFQLTRRGVWAPPARVPLSGLVTRDWLEQDWAFGPGACRTVAQDRIPDGITEHDAVHLLTSVGWPAGEEIAGLRTSDLNTCELRAHPDLSHLFTGLGTLGGRPLLLDGTSGHVLLGHRNPTEEPPLPIASSLGLLLRLILLQHTVFSVPMILGDGDAEDLERSADSWLRAVDELAADCSLWTDRFTDIYEKWFEYPDTDFWIY